MSKGTIFAIEEFAVHDGPGIRKLVFFKGCPLNCRWCHNPEGISFRKELMVSLGACIHCKKCIEKCSRDVCNACGKCIEVCPLRLRKICGQDMEASELAGILLKGKEILIKSGGGITISGGEPLAQPKFLFDLISHLSPINIAIETSGHAPSSIFEKMVDKVNLVLIDVKHIDPYIHKKYTGVDNSQIIKNLKFLCHSARDFHVRIPLIPGVNDTRVNMEQTALIIKGAEHLKQVDLLPYHQTAGAKYPMIKKKFNPGFDPGEKINIWRDVFENHKIKVNLL